MAETETESHVPAINLQDLLNGSSAVPGKQQAPDWKFRIGGVPLLNVSSF
jgi:hypothetical protein